MEKHKISLEEVIDFVIGSDSEISDLEEENSDENETLDIPPRIQFEDDIPV